MRFITLVALTPLVLSIPATRRDDSRSFDETALSLQPASQQTCHDPQTKELCPSFNSVMLMCCDLNPSKDDHVEACKRMMLDKDVCGGQVIMQTTMDRCCSFEWSCTGNGWCGLKNESLSHLKKMGDDNVPVTVVTEGLDEKEPSGFNNCVSLTKSATDDWCSITCATSDCPKTICKCAGSANYEAIASGAAVVPAAPVAPSKASPTCVSLTDRVTDDWCSATCAKTKPADAVASMSGHGGEPSKLTSPCPPELCTKAGVSLTDRVSDLWCAATCNRADPVTGRGGYDDPPTVAETSAVAMATGTCLPELCACGSSAQRKLAQRRAAKPPKGGGTGTEAAVAAESKEHRAAEKAGEDAAQASRAQWEKLAKEKAAAQENELGMREAMDNARAGSNPNPDH